MFVLKKQLKYSRQILVSFSEIRFAPNTARDAHILFILFLNPGKEGNNVYDVLTYDAIRQSLRPFYQATLNMNNGFFVRGIFFPDREVTSGGLREVIRLEWGCTF